MRNGLIGNYFIYLISFLIKFAAIWDPTKKMDSKILYDLS